ncbi:MAG TPA: AarF/ABC1/UbiB kinase family protein [Ktedonobacterales bacterium]
MTASTVTKAAKSAHSHRKRYREIVDVIGRHGLGFMLGSHNPEDLLPFHPVAASGSSHHLTRPEHLRLAIEELGPTFIKLGQILSTRGDLLPQPYLDELVKLQDGVPPMPSEDVRKTVEEELGRPIEETFASFEIEPLASASIGQVHLATLPDGTQVVVKLRRPGVVEQVEEDLHILIDLAAVAERRWSIAKQYDLLAIAQEFAQTLRQELDYLHEGRNVERFAANLASDPTVHIPTVYWDTTTARILTLERITGIKISDVEALEAAGLDCVSIAHHATHVLLTTILEHGFFHADPHPGNLFVEPEGRIALIDFGMTGELDTAEQNILLRLLLSISHRNAGQLADVVLELGRTRVHVDRNRLRRDMQHMLDRYCDRALGDVKLTIMLNELLTILRWHHLRLSPDLALLVKTLGMSEGLGVRLNPHFNLMDVYIPFTEELLRRRFSLRQWTGQMMLVGIDALEMVMALPQQLRHILGDIERGGFEINIQPQSFEPFLDRMEQLTNRLTLGILAAAFTVGLAVLLSAYHPTNWDIMIELLFLLVLMFSGGFGTYILLLILRSRHKHLR